MDNYIRSVPCCSSTFVVPPPHSCFLSQVQLLSRDFGKHLLEVDDLLQKHSLQEADITVQAERVETLNSAALKFTTIEGRVQYIHAPTKP